MKNIYYVLNYGIEGMLKIKKAKFQNQNINLTFTG
jgi:hypothetical protein